MKNYKSFLLILVFIAGLVGSCQNIINPECYIALTNQSSQRVDYADVWLVAKNDSTKRVKLFEFEKLETSDTSLVFPIDFSQALSNEGYIEVNVKLYGNPKTIQSRYWEYKDNSIYFDVPFTSPNLLIFRIFYDSRLNIINTEIAKFDKGKIKRYKSS